MLTLIYTFKAMLEPSKLYLTSVRRLEGDDGRVLNISVYLSFQVQFHSIK